MIGTQVILAARVAMGLVFVTAALGKIGSRRRIRETAVALAVFGRPTMVGWPALVVAIGGMEAVTVVLVAVPGTQRVGLGLGTALLGVFCAAIAMSIRRGRSVTCRCFGGAGGVLGTRHLVRNGVLAALAGTALAVDRAGPIDPAAGLAAVVLGAVAAMIVIHWDDLATALS
jgi:hypothetical protein